MSLERESYPGELRELRAKSVEADGVKSTLEIFLEMFPRDGLSRMQRAHFSALEVFLGRKEPPKRLKW